MKVGRSCGSNHRNTPAKGRRKAVRAAAERTSADALRANGRTVA
jgi:hypothetical protein